MKKVPSEKVFDVDLKATKFLIKSRWRLFVTLYFALHIIAAFIYSPSLVSSVAIFEAAIASWLFVGLYALVDWYRTSIGFQLMSVSLFLAILTTVSLIPISRPILEWLAVVLLTAMPIISLNMVRILMKVQRMAWYRKASTQRTTS